MTGRKETLYDYLGRWEFTHGASDKFYLLVPNMYGKYKLSWGRIGRNGRPDYIHGEANDISNLEAFRRIIEKERGGYTLEKHYNDMMSEDMHLPHPSNAMITRKDLHGVKAQKIMNRTKPTANKTVTPKRRFSFFEWAGKGAEEAKNLTKLEEKS